MCLLILFGEENDSFAKQVQSQVAGIRADLEGADQFLSWDSDGVADQLKVPLVFQWNKTPLIIDDSGSPLLCGWPLLGRGVTFFPTEFR